MFCANVTSPQATSLSKHSNSQIPSGSLWTIVQLESGMLTKGWSKLSTYLVYMVPVTFLVSDICHIFGVKWCLSDTSSQRWSQIRHQKGNQLHSALECLCYILQSSKWNHDDVPRFSRKVKIQVTQLMLAPYPLPSLKICVVFRWNTCSELAFVDQLNLCK